MTLTQLAQVLGRGKSTVSYALRGSPMVSVKTQEWVQKRARELDYIPNPVASAFLRQIRAGGSKRYKANLAFLVPDEAKYAYLGQVPEGASERAAELGYSLDIVRCTKQYNSTQLTRLLVARGIMGVVIGSLAPTMGHMTLDWSRFAVSAFGYSMIRPSVHRIVTHHLQGIRTAFRMCRRKGFRRIGLVLSAYSDSRSNQLWSSGFLGMQHALPKFEKVPIFLTSTTDCPFEKVQRWVLKEKPDVVISHFEEPALGFTDFLKNLPWNPARVLLDREPNAPYAGIDQRFRICGRLLVDSLSSQIIHNERGVPKVPLMSMVDGEWVDHPSLVHSA